MPEQPVARRRQGVLAVVATAFALVMTCQPIYSQEDSFARLRRASTLVRPPALVARYGVDDLRRGELRLPPGAGPFPVAVVVHGGCWSAEVDDWQGTAPLAEALTSRGFATWNVEYRRLGNEGAGWPGTFEDIAASVEFVRDLARTQPLDVSRVSIVGHSSGAHLALWAASRPKLAPPLGGPDALRVSAVVAIDGPGDLAPFIGLDEKVCGRPVIVPFMGGTPSQRPEAYQNATPASHLPLGVPQVFVLGELAPLMGDYVAAARSAGDPVFVVQPAGADHFDIITPGTANGNKVIDFIASRLSSR